jgi:glycogen(starch) synthase
MRILVWSEAFWPSIGGLQVLVARLVVALRERGHDLVVVTAHHRPGLPDTEDYRGIPVHRFPFLTELAQGDVGRLGEIRQGIVDLKRRFSPELVHLQLPPVSLSSFFHLVTLTASPSPWVATLHGSVASLEMGEDTLLRRTLRDADWVTAGSAAVLAEAWRLAPEIASRSSVIPNCVPLPPTEPSDPADGDPSVLCVGRVSREKGFDVALTAFASVRARIPGARLVIAGGGPGRGELAHQAAALDLGGVVDLLGWVTPDRVAALMNAATVVVVPSRQEGFGLVALEAALMARPVVAARVGGLPEVVVHGETGLLVEPDDAGALADAITFLLGHPDATTRMGRRARERAASAFDWERCVSGYEALYRSLVPESQPV